MPVVQQKVAPFAVAVVAQSEEHPELRSLKEVQLSDVSSIPGCGIRW